MTIIRIAAAAQAGSRPPPRVEPRQAPAIVAVVALFYVWRDWRVVVGSTMAVAAITILAVNLREAFRS